MAFEMLFRIINLNKYNVVCAAAAACGPGERAQLLLRNDISIKYCISVVYYNMKALQL